MALRNRIFVSAHTTNFGEGHLPSRRHVDYHRARAEGGVGLIITEGIRVHPSSIGRAACLVGYLPDSAPRFAAIADAVHEHGTKILGQLVHTGRHNDNLVRGSVAWAPSARRWDSSGRVPHEMTTGDIAEMIEYYVRCATTLEAAGFDGLEVHFGHGHLVHQFLSRNSNVREDAYGGDLAARARFGTEVVAAILAAVSPAFAVGIRVSADDFVEGGMRLDDSLAMTAHVLDQLDRVDFVNVSHAEYTSPSIGHHVADMNYGPAPYAHLPAAFAARFPDTPTFAICRMTDLDVAEQVLQSSDVALVGMTRAHIADPHLIRKTREGRADEIRPCISCNFCIGELNRGLPLACLANPTAGRESEWSDSDPGAAAVVRRVLVVGGGPAGLETARVAAERGHEVQLWERADELGGQLRVGARGAGRSDLAKLVRYEQNQLDRLGVKVFLGREATTDEVDALDPDVVVLATGSTSRAEIELEGHVVDAVEVIADPETTGRSVVVLDFEGGWRAASVTETLALTGRRVRLLSPGPGLLWDINSYSQMLILERLRAASVELYPLARTRSWDGERFVFTDGGPAVRVLDDVDTVCVVSPGAPAPASRSADGRRTVEVVGDALAPRDLFQVVYQGQELARRL